MDNRLIFVEGIFHIAAASIQISQQQARAIVAWIGTQGRTHQHVGQRVRRPQRKIGCHPHEQVRRAERQRSTRACGPDHRRIIETVAQRDQRRRLSSE